ncbi:uncharacterized protein METZ01_LOCUS274489, partial [marine metagenome]
MQDWVRFYFKFSLSISAWNMSPSLS